MGRYADRAVAEREHRGRDAAIEADDESAGTGPPTEGGGGATPRTGAEAREEEQRRKREQEERRRKEEEWKKKQTPQGYQVQVQPVRMDFSRNNNWGLPAGF